MQSEPPLLSILICTRNRPRKIGSALACVLKSCKNISSEVIIVDQSDGPQTRSIVLGCNDARVRYYSMSPCGIAKARNYAIRLAYGQIFAFTDDDCRVDADWARFIVHELENRPELAGLFGRTLPYSPTEDAHIVYKTQVSPFGEATHAIWNSDHFCHALITKNVEHMYSQPCLPYAKSWFKQ